LDRRPAFGDDRFFGHGDSGGADQTHFCAAEIATNTAPRLAVVLNVSRDDNDDGQAGMHDDGIDKELPEALVLRIGDGGSHELLGARAAGDGLRDDADVIDAREAEARPRRRQSCRRDSLIAAEETLPACSSMIADSGAELMNIDGLIAKINALSLIHGDDETLLVDFFHRSRFWNVDFDPIGGWEQ